MTDNQDIKSPPSKRSKLEDDLNQPEVPEVISTKGKKKYTQNKESPENGECDDKGGSTNEFDSLRDFKVLDEVNSNDSDNENSQNSDGKSEGVPDEEIERMLDEDLPEGFKGVPKPKEKTYITKQKTILEEKGVNMFEVLPLDWMCVRHCSGALLYVHRSSRVCTLAKPYFIGSLNMRHHEIPLSAIPCLAYRRALEEEEKQKKIDQRIEEQIRSGVWGNKKTENEPQKNLIGNDEISKVTVDSNANKKASSSTIVIGAGEQSTSPESLPNTTVDDKIYTNCSENSKMKCPFNGGIVSSENTDGQVKEQTKDNDSHASTVAVENGVVNDEELTKQQPLVLPGGIVMPPPKVESVEAKHLTHDEVTEYCKRLFKFKTVNVMHFKRWEDRRKFTKARKTLQYPTLPEGTKLITIPAQPAQGNQGPNQNNKGAKRDWVMNMNGRSYLSVFHEYVRRALKDQPVYEFKQLENASCPYQATVYIGGMQYGVGRGSSKRQAKSAAARESIRILIPDMRDELDAPKKEQEESDYAFFDHVGIEDPRVTEFCLAACEPAPHAVLRTCLLRNFGANDRHIVTEMKKLEYQKIEMTMKVGKHSATVVCKNKKLAKQRASQSILQALHPHIHSWGSLLRLYGSRSVKSCKEKKLEEQQITLLQDKARHNEPNYAVLEKLKDEMRKLRERDEAVVPIGTLRVENDLPSHSGSNLNNISM